MPNQGFFTLTARKMHFFQFQCFFFSFLLKTFRRKIPWVGVYKSKVASNKKSDFSEWCQFFDLQVNINSHGIETTLMQVVGKS